MRFTSTLAAATMALAASAMAAPQPTADAAQALAARAGPVIPKPRPSGLDDADMPAPTAPGAAADDDANPTAAAPTVTTPGAASPLSAGRPTSTVNSGLNAFSTALSNGQDVISSMSSTSSSSSSNRLPSLTSLSVPTNSLFPSATGAANGAGCTPRAPDANGNNGVSCGGGSSSGASSGGNSGNGASASKGGVSVSQSSGGAAATGAPLAGLGFLVGAAVLL